jgi:tRNA dimethylallyltransferase
VTRGPLLVIVGPTAVGKTSLSLELAATLDGEVVSADSRLFYRGMDIGTAKPGLQDRARVRHHLVDIAEPDETVGLARFHELATRAIGEIHHRHRLPMLVGGSGQYVRAIVEGWRIPRVPPDADLRRQLEATAAVQGAEALHARLSALDPESAASIDARNVRRVIRAIEICLLTGTTPTALRGRQSPPYNAFQIGLTMGRGALYARADRRVDGMLANGLEYEVRSLVERGYTFSLPAMSGLGYAQFKPLLEGEATIDDVAAEIKRATHRLVRQQYNWFRLDDPDIHWVEAGDADPAELAAMARARLSASNDP